MKMTVHNKIQNVLGVNIRARHSDKNNPDLDPFQNPIIHKKMDGTEIVPLNITKLWGK
jgi:hypothetical protein